jgi:hypothetical protein
VLLGISKRGDRYLSILLIHGARATVRVVERRRDHRSIAINRLKLQYGPNGLLLRLRITMLGCCGRCSPETKSNASLRHRRQFERRWKRACAGKFDVVLIRDREGPPEMMANRSDPRLPNLLSSNR